MKSVIAKIVCLDKCPLFIFFNNFLPFPYVNVKTYIFYKPEMLPFLQKTRPAINNCAK